MGWFNSGLAVLVLPAFVVAAWLFAPRLAVWSSRCLSAL
jgi:hypothetical protein